MTKKDYIIKVLDALMGYRPLARGLKILVEGNALNDTTIDSLVDIFSTTIANINNEGAKEKIEKSKNVLEKIKKIEWEQHLQDKKSLEELDQMIKDI